MSLERRPSSSETSSLLREPQPSYNATNDVNNPPSPPPRHTPEPPHPTTYSRADKYWMLAGLWSGVLLGAFDGTVVATLLSSIGSEFRASNQASYIGSSYLLSVCCFTPLYGRLADIIGRKSAMLVALGLFGSGTICCGLAPSMGTLIAARTVAGMGGGGVMTVASIAVSDFIPLNQRGIYQGMANLLYGLGAALGGPLGGWVNDTFGWRMAFYMQAPVLAFSFALVATKVNLPLSPEVQHQTISEKLRRIDIYGSITLVGALASLLLGFNFKTQEELPWSHPLVYGLFALSAICCALFVIAEHYWAAFPVMPLRLITRRTPLAVSLSNLFLSMSAFSMLYNAPLYFLTVRMEFSALSGLHLLPHSIAIPVGSLLAGWIMRKTDKLYVLTLVSAFAAVFASVLASQWDRTTPSWRLGVDLIPQGLGVASFLTGTLIAMITSVYKEDLAVAIGMTYLFRTTGQVLGVSMGGALLQAVLIQKLRQRIQGPGASEIIDLIQHKAQIIPSLEPHLREAAIASYSDALRVVFLCQIAVGLLGFIACFPIQEAALTDTPAPTRPQECNEDSGDA